MGVFFGLYSGLPFFVMPGWLDARASGDYTGRGPLGQ
jgi:hypothetical protein